ncbi:OmpA family protein [Rhodobacteraceae bacterium NNCM2]|nr:OmpA family protein [Coraliihabitans acroporae]
MIRYAVFATGLLLTCGAIYEGGRRGAETYERMVVDRIRQGLSAIDIDWVRLSADGNRVELRGRAPSVEAQSLALQTAIATAPFAHVVDYSSATLTPVPPRDPIRLEIHKEPTGLTLMGRLSGSQMKESFIRDLSESLPGTPIHDLSGENAARPPRLWGAELQLAILATGSLSEAFLTVEPGKILIDGVVSDQSMRDALTRELLALAGPDIALSLDLRVPPRAIAPFEFVIRKTFRGLRVEKCAARNLAERDRITALVRSVGADEPGRSCPYGLGGPSGDWVGVIEAGIDALGTLPSARMSIAYNEISLEGFQPTQSDQLEAAAEKLGEAFDGAFSVRTRLDQNSGIAATPKSGYWLRIAAAPDQVGIQGRMPGEAERDALDLYARALFAGSRVDLAITLVDAPAPPNWQFSAQAALDALATLDFGEAEISAGRLDLEGQMDNPADAGILHRDLLSVLPGFDVTTRLSIDLPEAVARLPLSGEACLAQMNRIIAEQPVEFATGEAQIEEASNKMLDRLAETFSRCDQISISIAGFTDSQGAEDYNQRLSQSRAEAVMDALIARGVHHARLTAKGMGEADPVASNETPEGRAMNRRIEIHAGG